MFSPVLSSTSNLGPTLNVQNRLLLTFAQLEAIGKAGIPLVLVSCKCDAGPEDVELDPCDVEQRARRVLKSLNTIQTSAGTPETHKRGLSMILRDILSPCQGESSL